MVIIKNVTKLVELLIENNNVTVVKYIKKDKSYRDVNCTLNFDIIPVDDFTKIKNIEDVKQIASNGKMVAVYDNENKGWRHLLFKNIKDLKIGDEEYKVSL